MKPAGLATLFDALAEQGSPTAIRLSRPFDIAPGAGVRYRIPQLARLVADTAGRLAAAGARPGDIVAVLKDNHWDYALLACAAARLGAVPALLSGRLPAEAARALLARLTPAVLLAGAGQLQAARRAGVDLAGTAARTLQLGGGQPVSGVPLLAEVSAAARPPGAVHRSRTDTLVITHTSGTTGLPKLVGHSAATIIDRLARFEATRIPVVTSRRDDTVAAALPFWHGRGIPWTVSVLHLRPRKVLIVAETEPDAARRLLSEHPPTTFEAAPATYHHWRSLAVPGEAGVFRDVRLYISTFDAVHPPTVRDYLHASRRRRPVWIQAWGQTETGPLTFRPLTRRAVAGTGGRHPTTRHLGWPVPGRTRLRVVDPQTLRPLGRGQTGLVLAKTKARGTGYAGEQQRWAAKVHGTWWNTGDLGRLTRTGGLVLVDREADSVPGLSCLETEDVIEDRMPAVLEATVLSVRGRPPQPVLVTEDGRLDAGQWRQATRDLPELAEPVVLSWQQIPRTGTGKVRRHALRRQVLPADAPDAHSTGRWT